MRFVKELSGRIGIYCKQVRIHESTVACDWAGAVLPENHEKNEILDILDILENFGHF